MQCPIDAKVPVEAANGHTDRPIAWHLVQEAEGVERALVVTAHPDDVDFGAAGTIARLVADGVTVTYCIVTDGDAGGFDENVPRIEIPRIRRDEQRAAAEKVGVRDVQFLGYGDGRLEVTLELRKDIARVIRAVQPDLVITQSAERNWQRVYTSHPDHIAVGEATMCAVYPDARNPFAFPELLADGHQAWACPEVWVMGHPSIDLFVDVTDTFDVKVEAIMAHESQMPDPEAVRQRVREWLQRNAEMAGLGDGRLAEGFLRVDTH
jgi:LmbE family N-acetylglucosaminyl deacetylase